jgi:hypothetical protein
MEPACVSAGFCLSEIARQQKPDKRVVFRAEAAFAQPEILQAQESRGVKRGRHGESWRRLSIMVGSCSRE